MDDTLLDSTSSTLNKTYNYAYAKGREDAYEEGRKDGLAEGKKSCESAILFLLDRHDRVLEVLNEIAHLSPQKPIIRAITLAREALEDISSNVES